jgi:parvulin-like peptidyl-prolyl isomerase
LFRAGEGATVAQDRAVFRRAGEVKDLDDALFSIPVGGFSGVIKTKQGYEIFRVEEKRAASNIRYAGARKFLADYLIRAAERAEFVRFVEGLRKAAAIDIRAGFAKKRL